MAQMIKPRQCKVYRTDKEVGGVFKIVVGVCIDNGPVGCDCDNCYGTTTEEKTANGGRGKNHLYESYDTYVKRLSQETDNPTPLQKFMQEGYVDPTYSNDLIESKGDLCARYNSGRDSTKFIRVSASQPGDIGATSPSQIQPASATSPSPPKINLDAMSFKDLQAYAAEEEVDLKGAKTKEEALKILKTV